jgi:glycosyltransferase involved in cell wall biosynthesis
MRIVSAVYPIYIDTDGPGYACQRILDAMGASGIAIRLYCVAVDRSIQRRFLRLTLPLWAQRIGYRLCSEKTLARITEWRFTSALLDQDVAYIWPGTDLSTFQKAKAAGCIVVAENINTHQMNSKRILDREYQRLGMIPMHGISDQNAAVESSKLDYVDFVYSPSPCVTSSLIDAGVPLEKIISTSYGLSSSDLFGPDVDEKAGQEDGFVAVFVGRIGIRKGVHLLLDYWVKSGVKGTLKLVGNIEATARHLVEPYLARSGIQHVGFCRDLKQVYRDANLFLFPSLEEGSPLVTYLSLGAGLPSLVSPMGSGGIIRNGIDGMVIDPHDEAGWISAIRSLAGDPDLRATLGANARAHAEDYLWEKVGRQRLDELMKRIEKHSGMKP